MESRWWKGEQAGEEVKVAEEKEEGKGRGELGGRSVEEEESRMRRGRRWRKRKIRKR